MKHQNNHPRQNRGPRPNHQDTPTRNLTRDQPDADDQSNPRPFKKRFIKRDGKQKTDRHDEKGNRKGQKRGEERDLDRELRDYWLTQKGGKPDEGKYGLKQI